MLKRKKPPGEKFIIYISIIVTLLNYLNGILIEELDDKLAVIEKLKKYRIIFTIKEKKNNYHNNKKLKREILLFTVNFCAP